jgi:hypothetical protein
MRRLIRLGDIPMETKKPMTQSEWESLHVAIRQCLWPPSGVTRAPEELHGCRSLPETQFASEAEFDARVEEGLRAWARRIRGD